MADHRADTIAAGQPFVVDRFQPGDAEGLVKLVSAIYGLHYPIALYYDPDRLREENASGRMHSVVARTPAGEIVAHGAMYRSSPPFEGLLEVGQYLVLPTYRKTYAAFRINAFIAGPLLEQVGPAAIFGEAVCHHLATQKVAHLIGARDYALEPSLMPAATYDREGAGTSRGTCLLSVRCDQDRPRTLHVPTGLQSFIRTLLDGSSLPRRIEAPAGRAPHDSLTELMVTHYPDAQVSRACLPRVGADAPARLEEWLAGAAAHGTQVEQVFVSLAQPWVESALDPLQGHGFFCCGLVPRWLDDDALLLQRVREPPDFAAIRTYSDQARYLRESVQGLWSQAADRMAG